MDECERCAGLTDDNKKTNISRVLVSIYTAVESRYGN